jgi:ring-1,2-phenylacetyl-CoA epoxidase subunit PaaE
MSINAGFHKLRIAEVRRETPDAVSVRFEIPEHLKEIFASKPGNI